MGGQPSQQNGDGLNFGSAFSETAGDDRASGTLHVPTRAVSQAIRPAPQPLNIPASVNSPEPVRPFYDNSNATGVDISAFGRPAPEGRVSTQRVPEFSMAELQQRIDRSLSEQGGYSKRLMGKLDEQTAELEQSIAAAKKRVEGDGGWGLRAWGRWLTGSARADAAHIENDTAILEALREERAKFGGAVQAWERQARELVGEAHDFIDRAGQARQPQAQRLMHEASLKLDTAYNVLLRPEQHLEEVRKQAIASREVKSLEIENDKSKESPTSWRNMAIMAAAIGVTIATAGAAGPIALAAAFAYGVGAGLLVGSAFNLAEQGTAYLSGEKTMDEACAGFGRQFVKDFGVAAKNAGMTAAGFGVGGFIGRGLGLVGRLLPATGARALGLVTMPLSSAVTANTSRVIDHVVLTRVMGQKDEGFARDLLLNGAFAAIAAPISRFMPPTQATTCKGFLLRGTGHLAVDGGLTVAQNYCEGRPFTVESNVETFKMLMFNRAVGLGSLFQYNNKRFGVSPEEHPQFGSMRKPTRHDREALVRGHDKAEERKAAYNTLEVKEATELPDHIRQRQAWVNHEKLVAKAKAKLKGAELEQRLDELHQAVRKVEPDAPGLKLRALELLGLNPKKAHSSRAAYETEVLDAYEKRRQAAVRKHTDAFADEMAPLETKIRAETDIELARATKKLERQHRAARQSDADLANRDAGTERDFQIASGAVSASPKTVSQAFERLGLDPKTKVGATPADVLRAKADAVKAEYRAERQTARDELGVKTASADEGATILEVDAVVASKKMFIGDEVAATIGDKFAKQVNGKISEFDGRLQRELRQLDVLREDLVGRPLPERCPPYIELGIGAQKSAPSHVYAQWKETQAARDMNGPTTVASGLVAAPYAQAVANYTANKRAAADLAKAEAKSQAAAAQAASSSASPTAGAAAPDTTLAGRINDAYNQAVGVVLPPPEPPKMPPIAENQPLYKQSKQRTRAFKTLEIEDGHLRGKAEQEALAESNFNRLWEDATKVAGWKGESQRRNLRNALREVAPDALALREHEVRDLGLDPKRRYQSHGEFEQTARQAHDERVVTESQRLTAERSQKRQNLSAKLDSEIARQTGRRSKQLDRDARNACTDLQLLDKEIATLQADYRILTGVDAVDAARAKRAEQRMGVDPTEPDALNRLELVVKHRQGRIEELRAEAIDARKRLGIAPDDSRSTSAIEADVRKVVSARKAALESQVTSELTEQFAPAFAKIDAAHDAAQLSRRAELSAELDNLLRRARLVSKPSGSANNAGRDFALS